MSCNCRYESIETDNIAIYPPICKQKCKICGNQLTDDRDRNFIYKYLYITDNTNYKARCKNNHIYYWDTYKETWKY